MASYAEREAMLAMRRVSRSRSPFFNTL
jgi:hypothetical protein